MKVKVTRAFLVKGEAQAVGTEVDLPDQVARELLWIGKVEHVGQPQPPRRGPATTTTAGALVAGGAKEKKE